MLAGVERGTQKGEVYRALGPGPLEADEVERWTIEYGYRTAGYLSEGEPWEVVWVVGSDFTPADSLLAHAQTPVLFRTGAMEGWGWDFLRETWARQGVAIPDWAGEPSLGGPESSRVFWNGLRAHCGRAYPGSLTARPPGDDFLRGGELLVAHFHACSNDEVRIALHIQRSEGEWDRSRTWIVRRGTDGELELRHEIRFESGTETDESGFGGIAKADGTGQRQEFLFRDGIAPDWYERGWRMDLVPGVRLGYGTYRQSRTIWRVEFDLSRPQDPAPPPPWGAGNP